MGGFPYPTVSSLRIFFLHLPFAVLHFGFDVAEQLDVGETSGVAASQVLPTADGGIDIEGIQLDRQIRPVRSAASKLVPLPRKASSTMSPALEQSRIASMTRSTGLAVGCKASKLSPLRERTLALS